MKPKRIEFIKGDHVAHLMMVGRGPTGPWITEPRVYLRDAESTCAKAMYADPTITAFIHRSFISNGPTPEEQ